MDFNLEPSLYSIPELKEEGGNSTRNSAIMLRISERERERKREGGREGGKEGGAETDGDGDLKQSL